MKHGVLLLFIINNTKMTNLSFHVSNTSTFTQLPFKENFNKQVCGSLTKAASNGAQINKVGRIFIPHTITLALANSMLLT